MLPKLVALFSTVAMLFFMGLLMFSTLPLLVLKHDTPLDARFICGVFNTFLVAMILAATLATVSWVIVGQAGFALRMGCIGAYAFAVRLWVLSRMDRVRDTMQTTDPAYAAKFRRLHVSGMLLNFAQLGFLALSLTQLAI